MQDFVDSCALLSVGLDRFSEDICPGLKVEMNLVLVGKGRMIGTELTSRGGVGGRGDCLDDLSDLMKGDIRIHIFGKKSRWIRKGQSSAIEVKYTLN